MFKYLFFINLEKRFKIFHMYVFVEKYDNYKNVVYIKKIFKCHRMKISVQIVQ